MERLVMGEFEAGDAAREAVRTLRAEGFTELDAYTPYPVEGMAEALGLRRSWIRLAPLGVGLGAAGLGYWVQWFANAYDYPINVGGRPLNAWPAFVPDAYESMILFGAFAVFFALLAAWGFPRLHHPVFKLERFASASVGGFWVGVSAASEREAEVLRARLGALGARDVAVVGVEEEE